MIHKIFLFPLSSSMTLSHLPLPYHIFEPRYRKMLTDSLQGNTPISVIPPSLHPYVGKTVFAGIPNIIYQHDDGRSDIVISGDFRLKILKVFDEEDYLIAEVEQLPQLKALTALSLRQKDLIREALDLWIDTKNLAQDQKESFMRMLKDDHLLLSYGVSLLVKSEMEKVSFLQCESWDEWAKLLVKKIGPKEINLGPYLGKLRF